MKKFILSILFLLFLLSGCSSSGVLPMGPDTFLISTGNEISPAYAKKSAIRKANEHCRSLGKHMMPAHARSGSHRDALGDNIATFDFTFRCLSKGDRDLGRPIRKKEADIIIEHK